MLHSILGVGNKIECNTSFDCHGPKLRTFSKNAVMRINAPAHSNGARYLTLPWRWCLVAFWTGV